MRHLGLFASAVTLGFALSSLGCGGRAAQPPVVEAAQSVAAARCARRAPGVGPTRLDDAREGATVALARLGDRTVAYVADEDDALVHTVDLATGRELSTTPLAGAPSQLLVAADGRVMATLRDRNQVQVLEPLADPSKPLASLCAIDVPTEPVALAATPDDRSILVTSAWARTLTALDGAQLQPQYRVALAREPRQVVVSNDGRRAFVAHVVGSRASEVALDAADHPVKTIDLSGYDPAKPNRRAGGRASFRGRPRGQERLACQGFALAKSTERVFAPQVLVDPGDVEIPTGGYGDVSRAAEVASVGVIDAATGAVVTASLELDAEAAGVNHNGFVGTRECLLPRAAAADAKRGALFVACQGIDAVVEYDAKSDDPRKTVKNRWMVGAGPTGVAIDAAGHRVVVWSQFDQSLSVISLSDVKAAARPVVLALSRKAKGAVEGDIALGRRLFHATGDLRISNDGRACASCHPDGRDDALTWATPEGPRNTPMLAGRLGDSGPFGWNGTSVSVTTHLTHTFQRLSGRGLEAHDVAALEAYLGAMQVPFVAEPASMSEAAQVARGRHVFESAEAACSTCHTGRGAGVDRALHDVGSSAKGDARGDFDTPSLRFVSGTAPYFHDGRYRTLRELLVGSDGKMGHTKHLSAQDIEALEAFLKTL